MKTNQEFIDGKLIQRSHSLNNIKCDLILRLRTYILVIILLFNQYGKYQLNSHQCFNR